MARSEDLAYYCGIDLRQCRQRMHHNFALAALRCLFHEPVVQSAIGSRLRDNVRGVASLAARFGDVPLFDQACSQFPIQPAARRIRQVIASRETLDHSIMYIFAVALEDGGWHHADSYAPERARRPDTVALWHKISTEEDPAWTARYHAKGADKAFGGKVIVKLKNGKSIVDELGVADAHPGGARPFRRPDYIGKFRTLADGIVEQGEQDRFLGLVERLPGLTADEVRQLNFIVPADRLGADAPAGIF